MGVMSYVVKYLEGREYALSIHTCNLSTQEVEAGESQVQGSPEPHHETLSQRRGHGTVLQPLGFIAPVPN